MTDPVQLLAALRARGVRLGLTFSPDGMELDVQGRVSQSDRAALVEHREGLVQLLLQEARLTAAQRDDDAAAVERVVEFDDPLRQFWEE